MRRRRGDLGYCCYCCLVVRSLNEDPDLNMTSWIADDDDCDYYDGLSAREHLKVVENDKR